MCLCWACNDARKIFIPYVHSIEFDHKLLVIRGNGRESIAEVEESTAQAANAFLQGEVPRDFGILINVSAIAIDITSEDALQIELCIRWLQSCTSGPIAIVSSVVGHSVPANIIALETAPPNHAVQAFYEEADARAWLKRLLQ